MYSNTQVEAMADAIIAAVRGNLSPSNGDKETERAKAILGGADPVKNEKGFRKILVEDALEAIQSSLDKREIKFVMNANIWTHCLQRAFNTPGMIEPGARIPRLNISLFKEGNVIIGEEKTGFPVVDFQYPKRPATALPVVSDTDHLEGEVVYLKSRRVFNKEELGRLNIREDNVVKVGNQQYQVKPVRLVNPQIAAIVVGELGRFSVVEPGCFHASKNPCGWPVISQTGHFKKDDTPVARADLAKSYKPEFLVVECEKDGRAPGEKAKEGPDSGFDLPDF